jgi:hypothetical protein
MPENAACLKCGYMLRGLEHNTCPECGHNFDPTDPRTFKIPRETTLWRRWAKPPPSWHVFSILVMAVYVTYASSLPEGAPYLSLFGFGCVALPASVLLALWIIVDYVARVVAVVYVHSEQDSGLARNKVSIFNRCRWAVAPLSMLLLCTVAVSDWPMRIRFSQSKQALQAAANAYPVGAVPTREQRWIGWYYVLEIRVDGSGVMIVTSQPFDPVGFVYRPSDPRPNDARRIAPCWYVEEW